MKPVVLSLCIPTYNFGRFIGETLASAVEQAGDAVEIVVVDGASTDDTPEVVRRFQQRSPHLTYHRLPVKGGIDRDLATTVSLARGEYCWLLSSDDVLKPGAVRRMLEEIATRDDIYLCNRTECDLALAPVRERRWLAGTIGDRRYQFTTPASWIEYFRASESIGALFSYVSSIVVRRSAWNQVTVDDRYFGTNYAHVARLLTLLQGGGGLKYIREALVWCRGENDSFRDRGIIRRYEIDYAGYDILASGLFTDAAVRQAFRDVVRREHRWYWLTQVRHAAAIGGEDWSGMRALLRSYGYSPRELFLIDLLGSSRLFMGVAFPLRRTYKRFRSWIGRSRGLHGVAPGPSSPR